MSNEIEKFDPSTLMQGVKDRIKATFVSLIPDDRWEQMVKAEIDDWLKPREQNYRVFNTSNFQVVVKNALDEECKKRLTEYLSSPEFNAIWKMNGSTATSKAVEDMIVKNSGEIMINMFGGMFNNMLQNFRSTLIR